MPGKAQVIGRILLVVFAVEVVVMLFLAAFDVILSGLAEAFVDAMALGLLSTPFLYFWVVKPFVETSAQSKASVEASEQHLLAAQRLTKMGSWQLEHASGKLSWSQGVFSIFDIDPQQFSASYEGFLSRIHPDAGIGLTRPSGARSRTGNPIK